MSVGDCKTFECATPLDFEQLLVSLFAVDSSGCVGLKISVGLVDCSVVTSAMVCASEMSLQEIIQQAIVDDGYGGNALAVSYDLNAKECLQDCGQFKDFEMMLKSLFVQDESGCFSLRIFGLGDCTSTSESFVTCSGDATLEQLFKMSVWNDSCDLPVLGIWTPTYEACGETPCGEVWTLETIVKMMFLQYTGTACGGLNLNWSAVGANTLTDLIECGKFLTFEDAFRASLVYNDCGLSATVWMIGSLGRGEELQ